MKNGRLHWMMGRSRSKQDIIGKIQKNLREVSRDASRISDYDRSVDWIIPSLSNSWVSFGGGEEGPGYSRTASGLVVLRGLIKSGGINTSAFQLPVGFRPSTLKRFAVYSHDGSIPVIGTAKIGSDGTVTPERGSNVSFSLSGVVFKAEQ